MPLLMYCIMGGSAPRADSMVGLGELEIARMELAGITAFYSQSLSADVWLRAPLKASALQFHRVLLNFFESAVIIPFRFPTILENCDALARHMNEQCERYKFLLKKLANKAQIDVRISFADSPSPFRSGKEFLQQRRARQERLDSVARSIRDLVHDVSGEWRERSVPRGIRGFALLERSTIVSFKGKLATIQFPTDIEARVNGPWPVTEFLEELVEA